VSYDIDITPTAAEDLAGLHAPVAEYVYQQLLRFAERPTRWSVPSHFPYVQG
jgi:hypothetical protein